MTNILFRLGENMDENSANLLTIKLQHYMYLL